MKLWTVQCWFIVFSNELLWLYILCNSTTLPPLWCTLWIWRREKKMLGRRKKWRRPGAWLRPRVAELKSASKCQQLCPSDRKEERRLLGTRETREEEEKAYTQNWERTKMWGEGGKELFQYYCKSLDSILNFITHSLNVLWNSQMSPLESVYADCRNKKTKKKKEKETLVVSWQCTATNMTKASFTLIILCVSYRIWFNTHYFIIGHIYCVSISLTRNLSTPTNTCQKIQEGEKAASAS